MARFPESDGVRGGHWPSLAPEPWKNGGGVTRTLAADEASKGAARWRVSVADITRDGPYSRFAGDDRVSVVLSGGDVILREEATLLRDERAPLSDARTLPSDDRAPLRDERAQVLLPLGRPAAFAGDLAWHGTLPGGPVRVLNLFVRRGAAQARVRCVSVAPASGLAVLSAGALAPGSAGRHLRLCLSLAAGCWQAPGGIHELAAGDFMLRPAPCTGNPGAGGDHSFTPARGEASQADGLAAVLLDILY